MKLFIFYTNSISPYNVVARNFNDAVNSLPENIKSDVESMTVRENIKVTDSIVSQLSAVE